MDNYQAIKSHPFFHKISKSEEPIIEALSAQHFSDFPSLYEIYRDEPNVIVQEKLSESKDSPHMVIAYLLDERFIVAQDLETLDCSRYNLLAAKSVSESAYHTWWYYRDMRDTRKGREQLTKSGIWLPKN